MVYMCVHVCVWSVYVVCVCVHIVVNRGLWLQLPAEKGLPHTGSTTMAPIVILGRGSNLCPRVFNFLWREMDGRAFLSWAQHSTG